VRCDKCGCDNAANDGPMTPCNECGRALCDECYGDLSHDWCKSCRCLEDEGRRGVSEHVKQVYDKHGIPILPGDTLKVYHYTGARRQRIYMYKWVILEHEESKLLQVSHLSLEGGYYWMRQDGHIHPDIEIVQGYGGVKFGQSFTDRKKGGGGE
jgi:hypothetical protein